MNDSKSKLVSKSNSKTIKLKTRNIQGNLHKSQEIIKDDEKIGCNSSKNSIDMLEEYVKKESMDMLNRENEMELKDLLNIRNSKTTEVVDHTQYMDKVQNKNANYSAEYYDYDN